MATKSEIIQQIISNKKNQHLDFSLKTKTEDFTNNLFHTLFDSKVSVEASIDQLENEFSVIFKLACYDKSKPCTRTWNSFLEKLPYLLEKLNLDTGAFDIAWNNDDLNTEPYFLEVSPFYQPNPIPKFDLNKLNYGDWKNSFSIKNNYNKEVIDLIFKIQYKYIQEIIKKYE